MTFWHNKLKSDMKASDMTSSFSIHVALKSKVTFNFGAIYSQPLIVYRNQERQQETFQTRPDQILIRLSAMLFGTLLFLSLLSQVRGWWFSSTERDYRNTNPSHDILIHKLVGAEFALETLNNDEKAMNLVEQAKLQMTTSKSCWVNAYGNVFAGCSKIVADQNLKDRLTWDLSDCFQKHSGRPPFPYCNPKYPTKNCLKDLDNDAHKVYLQYFLQIDSICHQLQIHAFKHQTERLVNDLKRSAEYAEEKLENIEERGKILLQNSKQIHGSLTSIDLQTQQVARTSKEIQDNVNGLKEHSEKAYEQSKDIAYSQIQLMQVQQKMKEGFDVGMELLHNSYHKLGIEINSLKDETVEIEKKIGKVGEEMFSRMTNLQNKADNIESVTGNTLGKQKQLLDGQVEALDGLQLLTKFQSIAMEESRGTLQQLADFGKKQQEELLLRQEQLQQVHSHLAENSKTILAAQEAFETKQARMLGAIDKLFALHNAMLIESRSIKVFIVYSLLIFVLYMFTSMKQTYSVRPRLYIGLCVAFFIELSILRCMSCSLEQQAWMINSVRSLFLLLASAQLLYAIYTFRDYEVLNHHILLKLIDKVNGIQTNKELSWDVDEDSEMDWSSWVDTELPEDVDKLEDPDYLFVEEVGENSLQTSSITRRYNLRNRHKYINY